MAGNKVTKDDIFESDIFTGQKKGADDFLASITALSEGLKELIKLNRDAAAVNPLNSAKDVKDMNVVIQQGVQAKISDIEVTKKLTQAVVANEKAKQEAIKTDILKNKQSQILQKQIDAETKASQKLTDEAEKQAGTLGRLAIVNKNLTKERQTLNLSTDEGRNRLAQINAELDKNNLFIKSNSDALTKQRLNVGNYTESIKTALKQSGLFGESIERITSISEKAAVFYELLHGSIHKLTEALGFHKEATEASIVAEEANTAATEANTIALEGTTAATEAAIVANESNAAALEAEAVATTEAEIATGRLTKALNFLKANPVLAIIAGVAALLTGIELVVKSTQEGSDAQDSFREATEAAAKAATQFGTEAKGYTVSVSGAAKAARELAKAEHDLRDESDANIITFAILEKQAAQARLDAEKENTTTQEKIDLLKKVIETRTVLSDLQREEALKEFAIAIGLTNSRYDLAKATEVLEAAEKGVAITRQSLSKNFSLAISEDQVKKADEAAKKVIAIDTNLAQENVRIQRRTTALIEADRKERLSLLQSAEKQEVEAIRITAHDKQDIIEQTRSKDLKQEAINFEIELANLKEQQKKLGLIDDPALKLQQEADFNREIEAAERLHLTNIFNINKRADDELDREKKRISDLRLKERIDFIKSEEALLEQQMKEQERLFHLTIKNANATIKADLEIMQSKARVAKDSAKKDKEKIAADIQNENAEFQVKLESLKSEGLTKQKYDELVQQATIEHNNKIRLINEKATTEEREKVLKGLGEITSALSDELQQRNQITNDALNRDVELQQRGIDRQTQLAAAGKDNELAFDKAAAAKAELQRKEELKRQQKEQEAIKLAEIVLSNLEQKLNKGEAFPQALAESVGEAFAAKGIAKALAGSFWTGGYTGDGDKFEPKGVVHGGEFVFNKETTAQNKDLFEKIHTGEISQASLSMLSESRYLPAYALDTGLNTRNMGQNMASAALLHQMMNMNKKLSYLEDIANKPDTTVRLDNLGNVIEERVSRGITERVTRVTRDRI